MWSRPSMEITVSRHFLAWLHDAAISLVFTTYQTNRLFLIGLKPDGALSIFERHFDRPMGLHADGEHVLLGTRWQIWELVNALPPGEVHEGYDRVYVPRRSHTTGDLDAHDVTLDRSGRIVFVNTLYSCLAAVSERYSFTPLWQPPFISCLVPEDRCHLNGLAMAEGAPAYVTAVSRSDVAAGWRERRHSGGCVVDVEDGEIVMDALSMPHSPRVYRDRLWVLNSGAGELGWVDRRERRFEPAAFCPGYARGMALHGDYAIVGLSKQRQERTFSGLALDDRLREKHSEARCGLWVVDLRTGNVAHWLQIEGVVIELYDVGVLPGVRRPMALGFQTDEIRRLLTIDSAPAPTFEPLHVANPVSISPAVTAPAPHRAAASAVEAARAEYQLGNGLAKAGHFAEAIAHYEAALQLDPVHVNALVNMGTAQHRLGDIEAASACYRRALAVDANSARANANLAAILRERGDLDSAITHLEAARRVEPGHAAALRELGALYWEAGRNREGRQCLEQLVKVEPSSARAHNDLGAMLLNQQNDAAALPYFEEARRLDPELAEAHLNVGIIWEHRGDVLRAREAFARALAIRDDPILTLHRELLAPPVWSSAAEIDAYRAHAASVVDLFAARPLRLVLRDVQASRAEAPFLWAYQGRDNLELKRNYARLFESSFPLEPFARVRRDGVRHVGFVATATHEGVFLRCMGGIVDRLDRRRWRVTVACPRAALDLMHRSLRNRDTQFVPLSPRFDQAITQLRTAEFDLIYFWEVGTDATNYFLPFCRLAPIQCTGWGWPETSAAPELDYHVTSESLAPVGADDFFSERLVRLPHLPAFCVRPPALPRPDQPERFGLRTGAHIYFCAQNLRKVHPDMDALLGGILRADPRGVAVFAGDASTLLAEHLEARWRQTLPDVAERMVIMPRLSPDDYMRLLASAHVALDTVHFSGANTAYDAFVAGTPVVTLPGRAPRSRYTAALQRSAGIEECVADTPEAYVEIAVRLASDVAARAALRARILAAVPEVFESTVATAELEEAFAHMAGQI
ncbi:MAG TPA: TIGR03032 family protein [Candidatus Binatia bacterium]|nr:TIGR03032 family protein [Candidatus Binatia bacterium]